MGSDFSKEIKEVADALELNVTTQTSSNSTQKLKLDPRSPTEGIIRTPIMVRQRCDDLELEYAGTTRRRWKSESELSVDNINASKQTFCVLPNDPRSPSSGICRTPIQVISKPNISGKEILSNFQLQNESMTVHVPDCRSPSLGICRTPIQIAPMEICERDNNGESEISESLASSEQTIPLFNEGTTSPPSIMLQRTSVSKSVCSPSYVYTDNEEVESTIDKWQCDSDSFNEKENESHLKRKLTFTPESTKSGVKMRTPLGSRNNFQDSPSQLLKIMQVQRVGQEFGNVCDNQNFGRVAKPMKKHSNPEWDCKDSTLLI